VPNRETATEAPLFAEEGLIPVMVGAPPVPPPLSVTGTSANSSTLLYLENEKPSKISRASGF
jgi:hypothetical protein